MVFTTERFLEVAIESWPEWDLSPRPLNSGQMLQPTELSGHEFNSHSQLTLYSHFHLLFSVIFHFDYCLGQSQHSFNRSIAEVITCV